MTAKVVRKQKASGCDHCALGVDAGWDHPDWARYVWYDAAQVVVEDITWGENNDGALLLYVPRRHAANVNAQTQQRAVVVLNAAGTALALERDLQLGDVKVPGGGRHWFAQMRLRPLEQEGEGGTDDE